MVMCVEALWPVEDSTPGWSTGRHCGPGRGDRSWFSSRICGPAGGPHSNSLFPKDCSPWEGPMLEQLLNNRSPWKGPMLEQLEKDCDLWEGSHAGEGKQHEKEGVVEKSVLLFTEIIFFIAACTVPCFGFVMKRVLITGMFYCCVV